MGILPLYWEAVSVFYSRNRLSLVFMFRSSFSSLVSPKSIFSLSFVFTLWSAGTAKPKRKQILFLLGVINSKSGLLVGIRRSTCISKPQNFMRLICCTDSGLCLYSLVAWSNFNLLQNSLWITFSAQTCLLLYFFCVNWLHSLILRWILLLSPHYLHLLFSCTLSIFALI